MDRGFQHKVIKNTLYFIYARVWLLAIGIWLTPYILAKLGNVEYGIWVLTSALVGYIAIVDLGFGASFVKYVAEYDARGNQAAIHGVLTTGLVVCLLVTALIVPVAYLTMGMILDFFNIPQDMQEKARFVLGLGIMAFLVANFMGVYQSLINGLQRMDVTNAVTAFIFTGYAVGSIVALESGFGIRGLAVNQLITQVVGAGITVYFARRLYPGLRFSLKDIKKNIAILLRYGLNVQISTIASLMQFQLDKLVVSRFIDTSHVTLYDIGSRLAVTLRSFPALLLSALVPASAELDVKRGRAEVYELYRRASKYVSVVSFPLFTAAFVTGQQFIQAWVGHGYDASAAVTRILCIGYLLNLIAGPITPLVQGMGRPDYQRNAEVLSLLLNLALSILLTKQYGFYGAPTGTVIAMSVTSVFYLWYFHRYMNRPLLPFLTSTILKPALCSLVSGLLSFALTFSLSSYGSRSRWAALLVFLMAGSVFAVSYMFLIFKSQYFDDREIAPLREHLPFMRS